MSTSPTIALDAATLEKFVASFSKKFMVGSNSAIAYTKDAISFTRDYWKQLYVEPDVQQETNAAAQTVAAADESAVSVKPKRKKEEKDNTCIAIFQKGSKKGQACGKACSGQFCGVHSKGGGSSDSKGDDEDVEMKTDTDSSAPTTTEPKKLSKKKMKVLPPSKVPLTQKMIEQERIEHITFTKNIHQNYVYEGNDLVYDKVLLKIIGKQEDDGSVSDLTVNDIQLCRNLGLDYVIPSKLGEIEKDVVVVEEVDDYEEISGDEM